MKIILTGATGYIGKHLLKRLSAKHDIFCIVRKSSDLSEIQPFIKHLIILNKTV